MQLTLAAANIHWFLVLAGHGINPKSLEWFI
jgi:hypothetical protein